MLSNLFKVTELLSGWFEASLSGSEFVIFSKLCLS